MTLPFMSTSSHNVAIMNCNKKEKALYYLEVQNVNFWVQVIPDSWVGHCRGYIFLHQDLGFPCPNWQDSQTKIPLNLFLFFTWDQKMSTNFVTDLPQPNPAHSQLNESQATAKIISLGELNFSMHEVWNKKTIRPQRKWTLPPGNSYTELTLFYQLVI